MAPVVAEIALENKDTFVVAKLNSGNNPKTVQKYRFIGHPTYLAFQDGKAKHLAFKVGNNFEENKKNLLEKILGAIDVEGN